MTVPYPIPNTKSSRYLGIKVGIKTQERKIGKLRNLHFQQTKGASDKTLNPDEMLLSQRLQHKQVYNFRLYKAKLLLQAKELSEQKIPITEILNYKN